jgi:hypothetical protein
MEFDSVIAAASQKSSTAAQNGATAAIYGHQNNRKRNCVWISSTEFRECDLIDMNNNMTFLNKFLSILDIDIASRYKYLLFGFSIQGINESRNQ